MAGGANLLSMAQNSHADAFYDLLEAAGCDPLTTQWERAFLAAIRAQVEKDGQPWLSDEQSRVLARIALKIGIELPPRVRDLVDTPEQARLLAFVMNARGDPRLTAWEEGFLVSISDAVRVCRPLSDKQRAVLARIATKVESDPGEEAEEPADLTDLRDVIAGG